jgi:hypothetical protein
MHRALVGSPVRANPEITFMLFARLGLKDAIDQMIDGRFVATIPSAIGIVSGRSVHS